MTIEAEARQTLITVSQELLEDIVSDLSSSDQRPLTGQELEDMTRKLYRVTSTLKTAQSLSTV
jgi:hypothetical protein